MKYLKITNQGVSEVAAFTVLGASSARDESDQIGQFGSGAKHAILCGLRAGIDVVIYCGTTKIVPSTDPQTIHGKQQERVKFTIDGKVEQSSMVLDFGALDWTSATPMMLREFVSNSLDASGGDWSDISFQFVDEFHPNEDETQVYVELTQDVREWVSECDKMFLHVSGKQDQHCIPSSKSDTETRFYRKGVFIRSIDTPSLYHYNFGGDVKIDESRNMDSYAVRAHAAAEISKDRSAIAVMIANDLLTNPINVYESKFDSYDLDGVEFASVFREIYGEDTSITTSANVDAQCRDKGVTCILFPINSNSFLALRQGKVKSGVSSLTLAEEEGFDVSPAPLTLQDKIESLWELCRDAGVETIGDLDDTTCVVYTVNPGTTATVRSFYDRKNRVMGIQVGYEDYTQIVLSMVASVASGYARESYQYGGIMEKVSAYLIDKD